MCNFITVLTMVYVCVHVCLPACLHQNEHTREHMYGESCFCNRPEWSHLHQPILAAHIHLIKLMLDARWAREDDSFHHQTQTLIFGHMFDRPNPPHTMYNMLDLMQTGNPRQYLLHTSPSFYRVYEELQEYVFSFSSSLLFSDCLHGSQVFRAITLHETKTRGFIWRRFDRVAILFLRHRRVIIKDMLPRRLNYLVATSIHVPSSAPPSRAASPSMGLRGSTAAIAAAAALAALSSAAVSGGPSATTDLPISAAAAVQAVSVATTPSFSSSSSSAFSSLPSNSASAAAVGPGVPVVFVCICMHELHVSILFQS